MDDVIQFWFFLSRLLADTSVCVPTEFVATIVQHLEYEEVWIRSGRSNSRLIYLIPGILIH